MAWDIYSIIGIIIAVILPFYIIMRIYVKWLHPIAVSISDFLTKRK
jgi:hypothetical protein